MIIFKSVSYKNFLAAGNIPIKVPLNSGGTSLIIGENGAGKSTLIEALVFALFNKSFRKVNKNQLINSINGKDCLVEVEFSIGSDEWLVRRGVKPNVFEIHQNGKLLDQSSSSIDQQRWLEQYVLKLNYKSFTQIVVLGSSTFVPFMQLTASSRREVIEDLLDLKVFSNMNVILKERIKELNDEHSKISQQIQFTKTNIKMQQDFIKALEAKQKNTIGAKTNQKSVLNEELKSLQGELKELEKKYKEVISKIESLPSLESCQKELSDYKTNHNSIEFDIASYEDKIKFFEDHENCPTCSQSIIQEFREPIILSCKDSIKTLKLKLEDLDTKIADTKLKIQSILLEVKEKRDLYSKIKEVEIKINSQQKLIDSINSELSEIKKDTTDIDREKAKIVTMASTGIKLDADLKENDKTMLRYQFLSTLLKDTGIKSEIIKRYLPLMNKCINEYLKEFDFYVNFTLNEEFNEVITSLHREDFTYTSFSEGERMRIDLALMFTWRTIARVKNSSSTNLLILDEVFDSSLDSTGTEDFLRIIKNISKSEDIFIISHKSDLPLDKFDKIMKFSKSHNFSNLSVS